MQSTSSRTVMLVNVPKDRMSEVALREMSSGEGESGGSRQVWLARRTKDIEEVFDDRNDECLRLEAAEAKLQKLALKNVEKGKVAGRTRSSTDGKTGSSNPVVMPKAGTQPGSNHVNLDPEDRTNKTEALMDQYLLPKQKKKKTTWKQGFLGLFGTKMDFKSSPAFIRSKNEELEKMRAKEDEMEMGNVAWIRFPSQVEAHRFARTAGNGRKNMIKTGIEVHPDDIVWANTKQNAYQRKVGAFLGILIPTVLIIMWIPITVFIGSIVSLTALCR